MPQPRAITRFCGATSLHYVTITAPLNRDPKLISNNMAAVLAMFDGLSLVCSAASRSEDSAIGVYRGAKADLCRDAD